MNPKLSKLIDRLIDTSLTWQLFGMRKQKPGETILKLSEEERMLLKDITSDDFNHRIK